MNQLIESYIATSKQKLYTLEKIAGKKPKTKISARFDKRFNKTNYYTRSEGTDREVYVRKADMPELRRLQEKYLARNMADALRDNIKVMEGCLAKLLPVDEKSIIKMMPKAYRPLREKFPVHQSENPYRRENLKLTTSFGLYVRSKGELAIAELLHSFDIEFHYERRLSIVSADGNPVDYYPDFTIVLPGGRIIYWEHQGLLTSPNYAQRNLVKMNDYNRNGIYVSHNLILTAEGPDNDIDMEGIRRMVVGWLVPMM